MSTQDTKKAKRRKLKKLYNPGQVSSVALQVQNELPENTRCNESEDLKEIEKFMDAPYDCDSPMPPLSRGPNPYLGGERCLLCRCERPDPPNASKIREETVGDDKNKGEDASSLSALPLWVCPNCRRSVEEVEKKSGLYSLDPSLLDQEFTVDSSSLPFLSDMNLGTTPSGESGSVNGSVCTCEACTERRQIEHEHERETQELQKCWMELRKAVWLIYYHNGECEEEGLNNPPDPELTMPDESRITELVHRLSSRDPHQLFRRLESQARELVLEKKVNLLHLLTSGHKTVAEAREFVGRLLEEYSQLCKAARKLAGLLQELEQEHLKKFKVTWELHNKHLFQSIAYTDPMVQKSLPTLIKLLRQGAASQETYHEEKFPNLLQRYLKFDDEMSVVNVVWRDCQLLIEQYNEEQEASKVKQKMLKEDWLFFKQQRKLLEQQVLKRSSNQTATQLLECTAGKCPFQNASMSSPGSSIIFARCATAHLSALHCDVRLEAHFTETMRHLLQGTKPSPEECHCPRCNWKRCPCDECTIMHMITCGIINPDSVDNNSTQAPNFNHDSSSYLDDVTPPSMSSTSSSSGQSSPLMVDPEKLALHLTDCQKENVKEELDEAEEASQSDEEEEEEDDDDEEEEEEEDYEEEEEDEEEEDEEEDDDLDEEEDEEADEENTTLQASEFPPPTSAELPPLTAADYPQPLNQQGAIPLHPNIMQGWSQDQLNTQATTDAVNKVTNCDCHHCVSQAKAQQVPQEEGQCMCHVCLQQRGKIVSTTLPQHLPAAPRPELHLYPHIHGHTGHVRPLLQPHLYDLHMPMRQPKPVVPPAKVPLKLDFDTPEGLQEHMYHAYGEWDNTYNVHRMLDSHKFGAGLNTELLPPPPLPTGSFISETLSMDGSAFINPVNTSSISSHPTSTNMMVPSRPFDIPASTIVTAMSQPPAAQTESCQKATVRRASRSTTNNKHQVISQGQSNGQVPVSSQSPPVTRPATMGGNSAIQLPGEKIQRCKHASSQSKLTLSQQHVNHSLTTAGGHPPNRTPSDLTRGSAPRKDDGGKGSNINLINPPHSCNHGHSRSPGHPHQPGVPISHSGGCSNALPQSANGSNVSVGTSTICNDHDCEANHDDNYDSIDDSGSEQSSSTSTSNQKEGKYCDCCYCEFFGHSNPPSLPTSKNYAEMRDRLRLRLKRKNEAKQDDTHKPMNSLCTASSKSRDPLDVKGLDELLKFINGVDDPKDKQLSAKAAKRARQKQRKAEEKARKIEEERQKLRQAEKAKKEAAKAKFAAESICKASRHSNKDVVLERFLVGEESPGPQRKTRKAQSRLAMVQDDPAGNKTPEHCVKTFSASSKDRFAETKTSSFSAAPSSNRTVNAAGREIKTAVRHQSSKTNHLINDKRITMPLATPKPPASNDSAKGKIKEEAPRVTAENPMSLKTIPANMADPSSPKRLVKRNPNKKVIPMNPLTTTDNPVVPVSNSPSRVTNGSPRTTPQPNKTSQVTAISAKKGSKKTSPQVQQNNLNNLNGGPQSPVNPTRNGLLIQQPANCQINGQNWPVNPREKVKQSAPTVSKPTGQPVKAITTQQLVSKMEPIPRKGRAEENGVNHTTEQNRRSAEQALRNQEQNKLQTGKNKKKNKKNRNNEDINHIDEIFMPRTDSDLEGGEMDDFERELEEFKRFCFDSTPAPRQKLQVNVNLKDIFAKKKSGLSCS